MTDDMAEARKYLRQAEHGADGSAQESAAIAQVHATLALGEHLARIAALLEQAAAPLRFTMHSDGVQDQTPVDSIDPADLNGDLRVMNEAVSRGRATRGWHRAGTDPKGA